MSCWQTLCPPTSNSLAEPHLCSYRNFFDDVLHFLAQRKDAHREHLGESVKQRISVPPTRCPPFLFCSFFGEGESASPRWILWLFVTCCISSWVLSSVGLSLSPKFRFIIINISVHNHVVQSLCLTRRIITSLVEVLPRMSAGRRKLFTKLCRLSCSTMKAMERTWHNWQMSIFPLSSWWHYATLIRHSNCCCSNTAPHWCELV